MGTFKEQLVEDLDVFINPDEMADLVEIDGVTIPAVIEERKGRPEGDPGVNISEFELHVKESDLAKPIPGQEIVVNGHVHFVRSVESQAGLLIIFTFRHES